MAGMTIKGAFFPSNILDSFGPMNEPLRGLVLVVRA